MGLARYKNRAEQPVSTTVSTNEHLCSSSCLAGFSIMVHHTLSVIQFMSKVSGMLERMLSKNGG